VGLDPEARDGTLASGRRVPYDIASLDIGITSHMDGPAGVRRAWRSGQTARTLRRTLGGGRRRVRARLRHGVIGGGVAGAEIAMACAHRLREAGRAAEITLIDRGRVLAPVPIGARRHLIAALDRWGVTSIEGDAPSRCWPTR
jgi:selenide,water dikinase